MASIGELLAMIQRRKQQSSQQKFDEAQEARANERHQLMQDIRNQQLEQEKENVETNQADFLRQLRELDQQLTQQSEVLKQRQGPLTNSVLTHGNGVSENYGPAAPRAHTVPGFANAYQGVTSQMGQGNPQLMQLIQSILGG